MKKLIFLITLLTAVFVNAQGEDKELYDYPLLTGMYADYGGGGNLHESGNDVLIDVDNKGLFVLGGKTTLTQTGAVVQDILNGIYISDMSLINATPEFKIIDSDANLGGGATVADSSAIVLEADGEPKISFYSTVGGVSSIENTVNNDLTVTAGRNLTFKGVLYKFADNVAIQMGGSTLSNIQEVQDIKFSDTGEHIIRTGLLTTNSETDLTFQTLDATGDAFIEVMTFISNAATPSIVINEISGDHDFRIESDGADSMLVADGATGIVSFEAGTNSQAMNWFVDTQSTDTYVVTLPGVELAAGLMIVFDANTVNTDGATITFNGFAAKDLLKLHDQALATGDIEAGQIIVAVYDGTAFQMISQLAQ